jgi:hypothetical protein
MNSTMKRYIKADAQSIVNTGCIISYYILGLPNTLIQKYNKLEFFVEDEIYWAPASTAEHLYSQLASKKYREIPINQLR